MAVELCGLLWQVLGSPETVAATCLASLSVSYPGLLMASAPFDQAGEIAERLDAAWQAAQADPAAAVVELPSVMLQRVTPESDPGGRPRRVRAQPQVSEPEIPEPELIPEPVAADHPTELPEPPEREPEDHPVELEPITQAVEADQQLDAWGFLVDAEPAPPAPEPEPAPPEPIAESSKPSIPPAPADWWSMADAAELLGISRSTIIRWLKQGRLGVAGDNWLPAGRTFRINPAVLELLIGVPEPREPAQNC